MHKILEREYVKSNLCGTKIVGFKSEIYRFDEISQTVSIILIVSSGCFNLRCASSGEGISIYEMDSFEALPVNMEEYGSIYYEDKIPQASTDWMIGQNILEVDFDLEGNIRINLEKGEFHVRNLGDNLHISSNNTLK